MNKHMTMVGGFAALMLLLGAGCGASQEVAVDTSGAADTAEQTEEDQQGEMETNTIAAGIYQVDTDASTVGWYGTHAVGNDHRGTVELTSGEVTFDDSGALTGGNFVIDMTTIEDEDDNARLEGHLRSDDFFSVETHPTSVFVLTNASMTEGDMYEVTGDLTIKGIANEITFPATIMSAEDGQVTATATFLVDRAQFDVRYGSGSFFDDLGDSLIEDNMEFTLDLVATVGGDTAMEDESSEDDDDSKMEEEEESSSEDEDDGMEVTVETEGGVEISL